MTDASPIRSSGASSPSPPAFSLTRWGSQGYDRDEVDAFLAQLASGAPDDLAGSDILGARFHAQRFRPGYPMREVDEHLDRVRAELAAASPEARSGSGSTTASSAGRDGQRQVRTWWIYALAAVLCLVILGFLLTQV